MAQRGQRTSYQQRIEIGEQAAAGAIEITFDPVAHEFLAKSQDSNFSKRFPALGLTKATLMGDPNTHNLPNYQFCLPFLKAERRPGRVGRQRAGTTL